ncbi:MAG: WYL domain-containing protein [Dehalococcoidia bacterium]|nr:MAG: WYL domain-containing protein [Dehalococcoidia bacterium]
MSPKTKNYDKKIFRLLFALNKLDRGGKVSTSELSKEFNVSQRTVQRDLELLNMAGFPLAALDDKGQHAFAEGFSLKKLMLTKEEASLLSFMLEVSKSLGRDFEESFGQLLKKVLTPEAEPMFYAKIPEGIKMDKQYPFMNDLKKAVKSHNKVEIHYVTEEKDSHFIAHPFKVIFFDGFWYLLVRTDEDERIIRLRLECIRDVNLSKGRFKVPANLKTMLEESVNIWFSDQRNKKVVLKVDKEATRFFKTKKYLPLQRITDENKDGSIIVETMVAQDMEVLPTILLWIPYVRVLAPEKLALDIKDIVKEYLATL